MSLTLSDLLGYTSIAAWLGAQFPQLLVNWRLKSAEGLALPFLVNWLFGDISNLIGCLLTHQLPFQTYLAIYFCSLDVGLLFQYFYYTPFSRLFLPSPSALPPSSPVYAYGPRDLSISRPGRSKSVSLEIERGLRRMSLIRTTEEPREGTGEAEEMFERAGGQPLSPRMRASGTRRERSKHRSQTVGVRKAGMVFLSVGGLVMLGLRAGGDVVGLSRRGGETTGVGEHVGKVLGETWVTEYVEGGGMEGVVVDVEEGFEEVVRPLKGEGRDMEQVIGRISAWTCTTLYLTSRLPQIWKNFVRKSVEGLSMSLFICAFLGNLFYVLSILTSPRATAAPAAEARAFLRESVPYLLGSGGVLIFDITIVFQGHLYGSKHPSLPLLVEPRSPIRGRSRGRRLGLEGEAQGLLVEGMDADEEGGEGGGYGSVPPSPPREA